MVLSLTTKLIIFAVILIALYFAAKHFFDIDILEFIWLTIVEAIQDIEWNIGAFILNILFTALILAFIWKSPLWLNSEYFDSTKKMILSVLLPIIGYPLAVRAWTK